LRKLIICLSIPFALGCTSNSVHDLGNSHTSDTISEQVVKVDSLEIADDTNYWSIDVVLSENSINDIKLPFPRKGMTKDLAKLFQGCSISKEVGQQDGPDFLLYSINFNERELGFFAMDDTDTFSLDRVYIKDSVIQDQYGLKVGDDISKIKDNRGTGTIGFDPYHFHMYYSYKNSRISYKLIGDLSLPGADNLADVVVEEKDIVGWEIQYIIWR